MQRIAERFKEEPVASYRATWSQVSIMAAYYVLSMVFPIVVVITQVYLHAQHYPQVFSDQPALAAQKAAMLMRIGTFSVIGLTFVAGYVVWCLRRLPKRALVGVYTDGVLLKRCFIPWSRLREVRVTVDSQGIPRKIRIRDAYWAVKWSIPPIGHRDDFLARIEEMSPQTKIIWKRGSFLLDAPLYFDSPSNPMSVLPHPLLTTFVVLAFFFAPFVYYAFSNALLR